MESAVILLAVYHVSIKLSKIKKLNPVVIKQIIMYEFTGFFFIHFGYHFLLIPFAILTQWTDSFFLSWSFNYKSSLWHSLKQLLALKLIQFGLITQVLRLNLLAVGR